MSFHRPPWVLASVLAAGFMLTVAGCAGQITPLGPDAPPKPHQLASPIVLQAMRTQPPTRAGRCPAGSAAHAADPGVCYRKLGTPIKITAAAVSVSTLSPAQPASSPGQAAGPSGYGFLIALPGSDTAALTRVTTAAADAHGYLVISVGGRTWALPRVLRPFNHQFEISASNRNQALWLKRQLAPPA